MLRNQFIKKHLTSVILLEETDKRGKKCALMLILIRIKAISEKKKKIIKGENMHTNVIDNFERDRFI